MPKLSVLMACKNLNQQCLKSIQSILAQDIDLELIITVDGGEYNLHIDDARIKVDIFKTNYGMSAATNNCYRLSSGDYITVHDDDDWSEPQRFNICFEKMGEDRAITSYLNILKDGKTIEKKFHTDSFYYPGLKIKPPAHHCATVIKRDLWEEIGPYNENYICSDSIRMIKLATYTMLKKEKFTVVEKPLYNYLVRSNSLSSYPIWDKQVRQSREKFFINYENISKMVPEQFLQWCERNEL